MLRYIWLVCVSASVCSTTCGHTVFYDDFSDGDAQDGSPVTWTPNPGLPGNYVVTRGQTYSFKPAQDSGVMVADALDVLLDDTSIRVQGQACCFGGTLAVSARNQSTEELLNYTGGLFVNGEQDNIVFLVRYDVDGAHSIGTPEYPILPSSVRNNDVMLQLDVIGDEISLWGWLPGEPLPVEPLITAIDDTFESGFVGLSVDTDEDTSQSLYRFVHVASESISAPYAPEPERLQPGDANQDLSFDQLDLVQVLQAAKYMTGKAATWGEGDWDGAPGGELGSPPLGNGLFDQFDIIAALGTGKYMAGPYAATMPGDVDLPHAVPEPSSILLALLGVTGLLQWRRR